jgi:hypothetical protein
MRPGRRPLHLDAPPVIDVRAVGSDSVRYASLMRWNAGVDATPARSG